MQLVYIIVHGLTDHVITQSQVLVKLHHASTPCYYMLSQSLMSDDPIVQ